MLRVLLVEDDPMVRQVNQQFIENVKGFQVIDTAHDGIEGVEKAAMLKPDLVFMDVYMPRQDGVESLRQIRARELSVDVIAVTAANDRETIEKLVHLGVFDYIMKPFSFERMKEALENYARYKQKFTAKDALSQQELDALLHKTQDAALSK